MPIIDHNRNWSKTLTDAAVDHARCIIDYCGKLNIYWSQLRTLKLACFPFFWTNITADLIHWCVLHMLCYIKLGLVVLTKFLILFTINFVNCASFTCSLCVQHGEHWARSASILGNCGNILAFTIWEKVLLLRKICGVLISRLIQLSLMADWLGQSDYFQWLIAKSQPIPNTSNMWLTDPCEACLLTNLKR